MWFNSTQREEPYQDLTCQVIEVTLDRPESFGRKEGHRWCMVVVSSCREMFGLVQQRAQPLLSVATQEHSGETAVDKTEEGGDDVKSSCPLHSGLHTYYNGENKGEPSREAEQIP